MARYVVTARKAPQPNPEPKAPAPRMVTRVVETFRTPKKKPKRK